MTTPTISPAPSREEFDDWVLSEERRALVELASVACSMERAFFSFLVGLRSYAGLAVDLAHFPRLVAVSPLREVTERHTIVAWISDKITNPRSLPDGNRRMGLNPFYIPAFARRNYDLPIRRLLTPDSVPTKEMLHLGPFAFSDSLRRCPQAFYLPPSLVSRLPHWTLGLPFLLPAPRDVADRIGPLLSGLQFGEFLRELPRSFSSRTPLIVPPDTLADYEKASRSGGKS